MHVGLWDAAGMNKKDVGARKRTVTVTVGARTVELMEDLNKHLAGMTGQQSQNLTDLVGACLNYALTAWRREHLKEGLKVEVNHWE